jgi:hypothetical protein
MGFTVISYMVPSAHDATCTTSLGLEREELCKSAPVNGSCIRTGIGTPEVGGCTWQQIASART